jgi:hypothetical protein
MTGDTPTPRDLREDAENALRLAAIMPTEEAKEMLLRLAREFRERADRLEAALTVVVAPADAIGEIKAANSGDPGGAG